jgi:hypothetical protein
MNRACHFLDLPPNPATRLDSTSRWRGSAGTTNVSLDVSYQRMRAVSRARDSAIDGSKFKAANNRDKNFTRGKMERRPAQIEESVGRRHAAVRALQFSVAI